ncbi:structural protein VP3 [Saccharolobus shibatae B12]|uniref:Structural protein VP3 n=2 Tax=root TaxID=1 RepID=VP3_SSV1|nr:V1/V3 family capsid protein [Saccharolobus shibatae]NP_039801.1 virion structural protein [Sulfolobus spindle-shaped virus 1]P20225.1 RecName: Full=Structural protein VP3 [Sulfolobus spindle-shaped virus 1]CAA28516.1 VP3 protein [Sulfolobus sp.]QXJ30259.1 structural protein VP3 [Saccharolobus shibatae B12]CAA30203.1 VP3 protein [Sulfolobus spindle-shaped virus 1]
MEISLKPIIFLVVFIIVGIALFGPINSVVNNVTTSGTYTTIVSGTVTTSSFVSNPQYVGSNNATIVALVPLFYILVLIIVPAVVAYKLYKEE